MPIITLLSDFGNRDHYVAEMKGILLQLAPKATLVDVTHDIEPQNILHAAWVLRRVWAAYPSGTVHLAVVDPGVGSARKILVAKYGGQYVVAPDNGLITLVHRDFPLEAIHVAENRDLFLPNVSDTFHGRDVMSPLAARLSDGLKINKVGPEISKIDVLAVEQSPTIRHDKISGAILYTDRFGNIVSNIQRTDLARIFRFRPAAEVYIGGASVGPIRRCYSEVPEKTPIALIGSSEFLEIGLNCGSASEHFKPEVDTRVEIY